MLEFTVYAEIVRCLFLASFGLIDDQIILFCWANQMEPLTAAEYIASF